MAFDEFGVLVEIAKRKGRITTSRLARDMRSSQQTISRKIRGLERKGYIERKVAPNGQLISVTPEGRKEMRKRFMELKGIVERQDTGGISFGGHLLSGSGEGRYYIGQDDYFLQLQDKLGFRPFLGTLNIKLKRMSDVNSRHEMEGTRPVLIKGFRKGDREFGDIKCYPCTVNRRFRGAVILPQRTHHPRDIVEVIAPVCLRKELSLSDDDYVHLEVRE